MSATAARADGAHRPHHIRNGFARRCDAMLSLCYAIFWHVPHQTPGAMRARRAHDIILYNVYMLIYLEFAGCDVSGTFAMCVTIRARSTSLWRSEIGFIFSTTGATGTRSRIVCSHRRLRRRRRIVAFVLGWCICANRRQRCRYRRILDSLNDNDDDSNI